MKNNEDYAIEVQDVYKTFNVYLDKANSLKEKMLFWKRKGRNHVVDMTCESKIAYSPNNSCNRCTAVSICQRSSSSSALKIYCACV